ncbi:hypothetical protein ALC56_03104 [Trachymyrmex septentrionalis]|uniref:Uncharacterized protein n=1 Tax=Trachymyrmex septentrionalis TaxID=34720 RepID=A0A151JZZ1_9HYME|nr:hypothetical protein ALC56_03104 [Trachymyrmex septentrionalis]
MWKRALGQMRLLAYHSAAAAYRRRDNTWTPPDHSITTLSTSASSIGHHSRVASSWKKTGSQAFSLGRCDRGLEIIYLLDLKIIILETADKAVRDPATAAAPRGDLSCSLIAPLDNAKWPTARRDHGDFGAFVTFISRPTRASWFTIFTHPRTTIAVGLVSHRATTSGGRKGERRSPISHLVDTFIQNALITPSSTPPAAPCVSPHSSPSSPFLPRSRRSGINEFEHDNANFCQREQPGSSTTNRLLDLPAVISFPDGALALISAL